MSIQNKLKNAWNEIGESILIELYRLVEIGNQSSVSDLSGTTLIFEMVSLDFKTLSQRFEVLVEADEDVFVVEVLDIGHGQVRGDQGKVAKLILDIIKSS